MLATITNRLLPAALLAASLSITACSDSPSAPSEGGGAGEARFTVHATLDDVIYFARVDSLTGGTISFGQAAEMPGAFGGALPVGEYLYTQLYSTGEIVQFRVTQTGYERVASLVAGALTTQGSFRTLQRVEDNVLLLMTWPDAAGRVDWVRVSIPGFTVASRGSFNVAPIGDRTAAEIGSPIVRGGKVYMGAMYWNEARQDFADSMYTIVMDYPSFSNPTRFATGASLGSTGGWNSPGQFSDEQGDIYQFNIRSKFWYNMGTAPNKPALVTRIRAGSMSYDPSFVLNVSTALGGEPISLIGLDYIGNGIAIGRALYENRAQEWEQAYAGNYSTLVRIDLRSRTVTPISIPDAPYIAVGAPLVRNGKYYVPSSPVGGEAYLYEIDASQTGAGAVRRGARLSGTSLQALGVYANTTAVAR